MAAPARPVAVTQLHGILQMNVGETDSWNQLLGNIQNIQKVFGVDKIQFHGVKFRRDIAANTAK